MFVASSEVVLQAGCAAVAIILYYFFLTAFMWMLIKGIVLYILVQVFAQIDWKYHDRRYRYSQYGHSCTTFPVEFYFNSFIF